MKIKFEINGKGPCLIILPGLCMSHDSFNYVKDLISDDFKILSINLPCSLSCLKPDKDCSIMDIAQDVQQVIEHLGIENPIIVGHSMGALVALGLKKIINNTFIKRIVAISPPVSKNKKSSVTKKAARTFFAKKGSARQTVEHIMQFMLGSHYKDNNTHKFEYLVNSRLKNTSSMSDIHTLFNAVKKFDGYNLLKTVDIPCTIVTGEMDKVVCLLEYEKLERVNPLIKLVKLNNTGHLPHIEQPEKIADEIKAPASNTKVDPIVKTENPTN